MTLSRRVVLAGLASTTVALAVGPRAAQAGSGPSSKLWDRWTAHDPASDKTVDHSDLATFLDRYRSVGPSGVALIDYGAVTPADKAALERYVKMLTDTPISTFARPEQEAYWLNLYNAETLRMIVQHYPLDSILDVPLGGWFSFGPWDAKTMTVEGEALTLNDVEHRILRPIWEDARHHYGVNCASIGCPDLAAVPYTADAMDAMLSEGARIYVAHERGARVRGNKLVVSSIYDWFEDDFVRDDGSILDHLFRWATPEKTAEIKAIGEIFDDSYDWALNDVRAAG